MEKQAIYYLILLVSSQSTCDTVGGKVGLILSANDRGLLCTDNGYMRQMCAEAYQDIVDQWLRLLHWHNYRLLMLRFRVQSLTMHILHSTKGHMWLSEIYYFSVRLSLPEPVSGRFLKKKFS